MEIQLSPVYCAFYRLLRERADAQLREGLQMLLGEFKLRSGRFEERDGIIYLVDEATPNV